MVWKNGRCVRTGLEITTGARDFQADDEGSIPFIRSNVFSGLAAASIPTTRLLLIPTLSTIRGAARAWCPRDLVRLAYLGKT